MPREIFHRIELEVPQGATVLQACELARRIAENVREVAE